jgi:hypothetical protein
MLAFDRPTWFRPLNKIRTFFVSGQLFWQHYIDYNRAFRGTTSVRRASVDGVVLPDRFVGLNTDRLTEDEVVATLSASTSYGPGAIWSPLIALAYDPLGASGFTRIQLDYLVTDHILFKLQQDVYWGRVGEGPWFIGDRFGRSGDSRHETLFSATYQF